MNVRTKHWTLKPHRNMRQHKVFLRHELLKYNSEKSTAKSSALENYISSANLSLSGCSSAEPNSVSVGRCKFQLKKLYLQIVKKVDHLPSKFIRTILKRHFLGKPSRPFSSCKFRNRFLRFEFSYFLFFWKNFPLNFSFVPNFISIHSASG